MQFGKKTAVAPAALVLIITLSAALYRRCEANNQLILETYDKFFKITTWTN